MPDAAPRISQTRLEILLDDPAVLSWLSQFPQDEWEKKLLQAAHIGIITLQSVGGALDSHKVEAAFQKAATGLEITLKQQLADQLHGKLDINNKESPFAKMDEAVRKHLQKQLDEFIKQFSLDEGGSAVNRLLGVLEQQIKNLGEKNEAALLNIERSVGVFQGRRQEIQGSTAKGKEFEKVVYPLLAELARIGNDVPEDVSNVPGCIPDSKKGDHVVTLGKSSGVPGQRIIFECKSEPYTYTKATEEIRIARENRLAKIGVFIFAKGCEPTSEVGDFHVTEQDIFCTVDPGAVAEGKKAHFLEAAYKIARAMAVLLSEEAAQGLDVPRIRMALGNAREAVRQFAEIKRLVDKAHKAIKDVQEEFVEPLKSLEDQLNLLQEELTKRRNRRV